LISFGETVVFEHGIESDSSSSLFGEGLSERSKTLGLKLWGEEEVGEASQFRVRTETRRSRKGRLSFSSSGKEVKELT